MASITQAFGVARKKDPSLKFSAFQKTFKPEKPKTQIGTGIKGGTAAPKLTQERKAQKETAARSLRVRETRTAKTQAELEFGKVESAADSLKALSEAGLSGSFREQQAEIDKRKAAGEDVSNLQSALAQASRAEVASEKFTIQEIPEGATPSEKAAIEASNAAAANRQRQLGTTAEQKRILGETAAQQEAQAREGIAKDTGITAAGEVFERRRGVSAAEQAKLAGEPPAPSAPAEGETPEQAQQRLLNDARARSDFFQQQAGVKAEELATVSAQVADFGTQLQENQSQIQDLVNAINSQRSGEGSVIQDTLDTILAEGIDAQITPEILQQIQTTAEAGIQGDQLSSAIRQIVTGQPIGDAAAAATRETAAQDLIGQGLNTKQIQQIDPELAATIKPTGDIINPNFGSSLQNGIYSTPSGLQIPRDPNTGMPNFANLPPEVAKNLTSYDVFSLSLATGEYNNGLVAQELTDFYTADALQQMSAKIARDGLVWEDQINSQFDVAADQISIEKLIAIQDQELVAQRLELEKDSSLQGLNRAHIKNEALMKGMIDAFGLEGSSAQLAIMGNLELQFNQQSSQLKKGFAIEIAQVANNTSRIRMNFANDLVQINSQKSVELSKLRNNLLDGQASIDSQRLLSKVESITAKQGLYQDFVANQGTIVQNAQKRESDSAAAQQEKIFNIQLEGVKAQGGIPTIAPDGSITYMQDENGEPILSTDGQKVYNEMRKGSPKWNTLTEEWDVFDSTGRQVSFSNTNIYSGTPLGGTNKTPGIGSTFSIGDEDFQVGEKYTGASECVGFSRKFVPDLPRNLFTINDKLKIANSDTIKPGSVVMFDIGNKNLVNNPATGETASSGHVAVVTKVHEDGTFDIVEANLDGANTISERTRIDKSEIARGPNGNLGIYNGTPAQVGFSPAAGFASDGTTTFEEFGAGDLAPRQLSTMAEGVLRGTITYKDALVGLKGKRRENLVAELNSADFKASLDSELKSKKSEIFIGLDRSLELLEKVPSGGKGFFQGKISELTGRERTNPDIAKFTSFTNILGMQLTRMFEKGRISDADRAFYLNLMPNLRQSPEAAKASVAGLKELLTEQLNEPIANIPGNTLQDVQNAVKQYAAQNNMTPDDAKAYLESTGSIPTT